jgi:hypothetical protein
MKLKLTEEFTHKLTTLQKEIIEHINQVTNRDEEPGPLDLALAGITKEEFQNRKSRNRNIECEKDRKKVRGGERKLTDVNSLEEPDNEPRASSPLTLALAGITKEEFQNQSVNVDVPDPVDEEQTENSEIESDESDSEIDISNIRYAIYSESEED